MQGKPCAVVLGGYINGYSIIRELEEKKVKDILLFDTRKSLSSYSNKITKFELIAETPESLLKALKKYEKMYACMVLFPTDDIHLENLYKIHPEIKSFCFIPFNLNNFQDCLNKKYQYLCCEKLGVPYPKTVFIEKISDCDQLTKLQLPIIIKPEKRKDLEIEVFRNIQVYTEEDLKTIRKKIEPFLDQLSFLASEIIPGDGSTIYAYVGYRSQSGEILNEWTGKKLAQFPHNFGVFASASNQAPEVVRDQGRRLLQGMDLIGIAEPEFKFDARDGKYKLMEVNLRSMMWHRTGNLSGVNIQFTQYLDAIGEKPAEQSQIKDTDIHFVYFKHEFYNLLTRIKYFSIFWSNIFSSDRTHFAVLNIQDIKPFFADTRDTIIRILRGDIR
jgi:D-aspartate ligase